MTYDVETFLNTGYVDYVISGEGEIVFYKLIQAIREGDVPHILGVNHKDDLNKHIATVDLSYIEQLDSPYTLACDEKDKKHRILYFESSRGCPFMCQYCLSSREKGLGFFSEAYLKEQLQAIIESGAKTIKFLDRSFNANVKHALMILDYIVLNHKEGQVFQFEINADVLQPQILDALLNKVPPGLIRLEIGIQSTYDKTNEAVKRIQNFERLKEVVLALQDQKTCGLHLDLIAGLPYENFDRFKQSFDDVFTLYPQELQLGFLKLLRGTSLREEDNDYGYIYDQNPPYEMIQNNWLTPNELHKIHLAEDMLEKYWNSGRFKKTMTHIMKEISSPFQFFLSLGEYYEAHDFKTIGYQMDELFGYIDHYLNDDLCHDYLMEDYLMLFKVKPKRWYEPTLSVNERKDVIRDLSERYHLNEELLFRYAVVEKVQAGYLIAIYKDQKCGIHIYK